MSDTLTYLPLKTRLEGKDIDFLTQSGPSLKLSLYLPFDRAWRDAGGQKALLRDLRRTAAHALEARGALSGGVEAILAPVDALLADKQAYRFAGKGLALFSDGEAALGVLLPAAPAADAEIDLHFRIDGIFTQVFGRDRFYLLSLSQHGILLWDCDGVGMRALALDGVETDIRKTPHFEEAEFQSVVHSNATSGHGHSSAYAGIGSLDGKRMKKEIEVFFRAIDHGVRSRLSERRQPLVLAGVGFLLPIYRAVNTYPELLEADLPGNSEALGTPEDLHLRANALLQEAALAERDLALGTFVENLAMARSCSGYTDLVPCAHQGRLTHLFVSQNTPQWGEFEPATGRTTLFPAFRDGAVDLANLAAVHTVKSHAKAYAVPARELPAGAAIAGLYRG